MPETKTVLFADAAPVCWVEVILPLALPLVYTYHIPAHLIGKAIPGCRVEVVFGKNKKYAGIVKRTIDRDPGYATKPISNVLDEEPIIFTQQLQLWAWMSEYYMCSEGEVMAAALPANFKLNSETLLVFNETIGDDFSNLNDQEYLVAEALLIRKQLHVSEIQQLLDARFVYPVIKSLIDQQICFAWEQLNEKYRPKSEVFVNLHSKFENEHELNLLFEAWKGASKQLQLLLAFLHLNKAQSEVSQLELLKKSGANHAQLKALTDKGILISKRKFVDRIPQLPLKIQLDFNLSIAQTQCLHAIEESWKQKPVALLKGVTGSGKTMVYFKLIEKILKSDKQVLYLLPEIALTTQMIRRLQKHFGGHVAVYHSRFNDQERIEWWRKVRNKEVRVILGARSSLFLPFSDLGLIIIDEEHESSYKQQDPSPRYHARDTALFYATLFGAKVLLGSGTPSVESYQHALNGKYALIELKERYGGIKLPSIEIVNLAQVPSKGKIMLSPPLKAAIQQTLESNKQVILFQNRRGYLPYLFCGSCHHIPKCLHCDVSLTLHKQSNKLHCHYCNSTYSKMTTCVACGSTSWQEKNFGTEKIEETLQEEFPGYKIARMDFDTVKGKKAHDQLIQQFENKSIDLLVGTQMIVKGLDFDHVALVGILDADAVLNFTDFRSNEKAFQMMEQVSGRSGRKDAQGKVILQAFNTKHPVIDSLKEHDYHRFFTTELEGRKAFNYPPFTRLVKLMLKHKKEQIVEQAAQKMAEFLTSDFGKNIVGPSTPGIGKVRDFFIREILIRLPRDHAAGKVLKKVIRHHMAVVLSEKSFSSVMIQPDVDPQ